MPAYHLLKQAPQRYKLQIAQQRRKVLETLISFHIIGSLLIRCVYIYISRQVLMASVTSVQIKKNQRQRHPRSSASRGPAASRVGDTAHSSGEDDAKQL